MNSDKVIGVIDHGVGNSISILNLLRKIGIETRKISNSDEFIQCSRSLSNLIIPGVGAFDAGIRALNRGGLVPRIKEFASRGGCILGICLGMQLLFDGSEEGELPGLGLIPGTLVAIKGTQRFRVPHVGWTPIMPIREDKLLSGINRLTFYHNHSFALSSPNAFEIAKIEYSSEFSVVVRNQNVVVA
jgi:glutamine amidotransferase